MDARKSFEQRRGLLDAMADKSAQVEAIADVIVQCLKAGGKVFACGNGGSATQASHFVAELVGRYKKDRPALPAFSMPDNQATMTAVANDYSYADVFARQVAGVAAKGDVLVALTTSGNSPNVVAAAKVARERGVVTCALTGASGGEIASVADHTFLAPSDDTPCIQEMHLLVIHTVCELVENAMFPDA